MRYLFKRLDQQTTTTAHPQWAMGTHRSAPCPHLDGLVTDMDTLLFYEFPLVLGTAPENRRFSWGFTELASEGR